MDKFIQYKLYLGRAINQPVGCPRDVTDTDLANFLRDHVTPNYSGFTVYCAAGSWNGKSEKTSILEIMVPFDSIAPYHTDSIPAGIFLIAEKYKNKFHQESVMLVVSPALVQF